MHDDYIIAGAGVAGSYLAAKLANAGYRIKLYDHTTVRGCNCAWGVGLGEVNDEIKHDILNNTNYFRVNSLYINDIKFRTRKFVIINKPHLLNNFIANIDYDMIKFTHQNLSLYWCQEKANCINASSTPYGYYKYKNMTMIPTYQILMKCSKKLESAIVQFTPRGYAWLFPHPNNQYFIHVGIGDFSMLIPRDKVKMTETIDYIAKKLHCKKLCSCGRPLHINPFVKISNFTVGEALGMVHPSSGEGITQALNSARILYNILLMDDDLHIKLEFFKQVFYLFYQPQLGHEFNWVYYALKRNIFKVLKENKYVVNYIKEAFGIDKFSTLKIVPHMLNLRFWHKNIINTANKVMTH